MKGISTITGKIDDDSIHWIYNSRRAWAGWDERKGANIRGRHCAQDLASACVVEVDLVGLLEGGELGAGFGDGEG